MSRTTVRRAATLAGLLLSVPLFGACGDDADSTAGDPPAAQEADAGAGAEADGLDPADSGVPEECAEAFPVAFGAPDLKALTLLPADWPEPPAGATLCQTTSTADGSIETADYATDAPAEEVLSAYESALAPSYDVARNDEGLGEVLTGTAGSVVFELSTRDGAYSIAFSPS